VPSKPEKQRSLLDSYAILALLNDEPGAQFVADLLRAGARDEDLLLVNEINVGEVYYIVAKHRSLSEAERVLRYLETLPLEIVSNGYAEVIDAARVKARFPLSYADAFAVATAIRLGVCLVTGDPEFAAVEDTVDIVWL
jgi:predicted nucleic acid-binding protein